MFNHRISSFPTYLDIRIDRKNSYDIIKNSGKLYSYYGKVSPVIFENEQSLNEDYIEINTRDFVAALQRMLLLKIDHNNPRLSYNRRFNILEELDFSKTKNEMVTKHLSYFSLLKEPLFTLSTLDENGVNN